jgi:hypothetical protein
LFFIVICQLEVRERGDLTITTGEEQNMAATPSSPMDFSPHPQIVDYLKQQGGLPPPPVESALHRYCATHCTAFSLQIVSDVHLEFYPQLRDPQDPPMPVTLPLSESARTFFASSVVQDTFGEFIQPTGAKYLALLGDIGSPTLGAYAAFLEFCAKRTSFSLFFWGLISFFLSFFLSTGS